MQLVRSLIAITGAFACFAPLAAEAAASPTVSVMIVGDFHMSNPGRDLHNLQVDDVLAPDRQRQIASAVAGLARFRPTVVAAEWPGGASDDHARDRCPRRLPL